MRLTIGKKIGAGFLFLLLLATIVSGIMYSAIQHGIVVSKKIESIAKRMIKYLLFARSHEIWQREIL